MKHAPTRPVHPRPKWLRGLLSAGTLLALALLPGQAHAQADIKPPPPNVLLLVDTSGSMDYKTSSNSFPTCKYTGTTATAASSERSRWIELVEVLTGSIQHYDCQRLDRSSAGFRSEYALGGVDPYDLLYANPYNRPMSTKCVAGPGTLDAINKALFPANAINFHPFDNTAGSCDFEQSTDGILDAFRDDVRFGLMTFDTEPRPAKDMSGLWSYYLTTSKQGEPLGCTTPQDQEVGVRNPLAPPWEGRAVGFGNPALGNQDYVSRNSMIQKVLLATRPYGATPIAGMLDDARTYFVSDTSDDPIDSSFKFGPASDPAAACRHKSIVLLSDGQPNMDLRPFCEPAGCPYDKPEDIAQDLKSRGVEIYVIGFALPTVNVSGSPTSCGSPVFAQTSTGPCKDFPGDSAIQACCSLNRIAAAGGHAATAVGDADWTHAHFADNRDTLRSELSQAIGGNFKSTSRTPFINASGAGFVNQGANLDFARSFRFSAAFKPGKLDKPWVGELNRARYTCDLTQKPVLQKADPTKGDMFVDNVNNAGPSARKIFTVLGNAPTKSSSSMRPNVAADVADGVGIYSGNLNATAYDSQGFANAVTPEAIGVTDANCTTSTQTVTAADCTKRYMNWLVGTNPGTDVFHRCPKTGVGTCSLISEIFHSVPRAVAGRPAQFLIDSSYQAFITAQAKRPSMIYASSNDGFLHAFKIAGVGYPGDTSPQVQTMENNELWAFVPPGVMTGIPGLYPSAHQLLLDGTPAVKEVVATKANTPAGYRLERNLDAAKGGTNAWRTILVQSYGTLRPGYFAIDITDPEIEAGGPKFLWQLSTDSAGRPLFGTGGATPLITTVLLDKLEVAVAVLPGGYPEKAGTAKIGSSDTAGCARKGTYGSWPTDVPAPRTDVKCYYEDDAKRARSVTVVRLDSGEILRTFRQDHNEVPGIPSTLVSEVPLDSPMTGQPVAYPPDVAGVADRVFIGDQEGALWRLNFASAKGQVSDWTMDLFFDGFPKGYNGNVADDWKAGQPIISAPVMSVDEIGNITIAFSTGSQEAVGADPGMKNYVWSLTETPNANRTVLNPKVDWYLDFKDSLAGDRVIGEMALFNGDLFFTTLGPGVSGDACGTGSGKLWGMHYTEPNKKGAGTGGKVSTTLSKLVGTGDYVDATTLLGGNVSAYLSGATVSQQPTCEKPGTVNDAGYSGYGVVPTAGTSAAGKFQLMIATGDRVSTSTKPGISTIENGGSNAVAIDLNAPAVSLIVDSWAAIVE